MNFINPDEAVYFEVRTIFLKVREYKKSNSFTISPAFSKLYQHIVKNDLVYNIREVLEETL